MTQEDLGAAIRRSRSYVTRLESGKLRSVSVRDLCELCHALGIEAWQLLVVAEVACSDANLDQVRSISEIVAWLAVRPADAEPLLEAVRMAREYPEGWDTIRLLMMRPTGQTINGGV